MNVVTTSSIMVRASLRDRFLPIPDELFFPDWHVATRVAEVAGVEVVDGTLAHYRSHASNMGLGGTGSKFFADMRHNVRITRWHLRHLDLSSVAPAELVLAAQSMLTNATRAAAELGCWAGDVLPVTAADRAAARTAGRAARAADRAGDQAAALLARVRALAADPWDGAAHADLMIAAARMDSAGDPCAPARDAHRRRARLRRRAARGARAARGLRGRRQRRRRRDARDPRARERGASRRPARSASSPSAPASAASDAADMLLVASGDEAELLAAPIRFVYSRRRPSGRVPEPDPARRARARECSRPRPDRRSPEHARKRYAHRSQAI